MIFSYIIHTLLLFFPLSAVVFSSAYLTKKTELGLDSVVRIYDKTSDKNNQGGKKAYSPILMYHYIGDLPKKAGQLRKFMTVPSAKFESQILFLKSNGYQFLFLSELVDGIKNKNLPQKPVVLTFDDGYEDFYTFALPILKKYNAKSSLYIISEYTAKNYPGYITLPQLKELSDSKLIEIGSHLTLHQDMRKLSFADAETALAQSQKTLQEQTGQPVDFFCYPYGEINPELTSLVEKYYKGALTTKFGTQNSAENLYLLNRIRAEDVDMSVFEKRLGKSK